MSEIVIKVPEEWKHRAYIDAAKYEEMYRASVANPEGFWAAEGRKLEWIQPFKNVKDVSFDAKHLHIRWFYDGTLNVSVNCIDRHLEDARQPDRDHLGRRRSQDVAQHHLCRTASRGLPVCQCVEGERRRARRPGHDLPADDPRSRLCDAGLRAHRRDPFGRVRRFLAGFACRAHRGLHERGRDHGGRRRARRQGGAVEAQHRFGADAVRYGTAGHRGETHRRGCADARRARRLVSRRGGEGLRRLCPPKRWRRRIRCSSSTRPARPESPKACCTPRRAISATPRSRTNTSSTITTATSIGAPPMSAG